MSMFINKQLGSLSQRNGSRQNDSKCVSVLDLGCCLLLNALAETDRRIVCATLVYINRLIAVSRKVYDVYVCVCVCERVRVCVCALPIPTIEH